MVEVERIVEVEDVVMVTELGVKVSVETVTSVDVERLVIVANTLKVDQLVLVELGTTTEPTVPPTVLKDVRVLTCVNCAVVVARVAT